MFICGSGSFGNQEEDEYEYESHYTTPKRSKRSTSFCKIIGRDNGGNKNPYSDRGLDKFNELLADLDDKKRRIYTQMGSDHISYVRFVYTNDSKRVKPIIVKAKDKNEQDMKSPTGTITSPKVDTIIGDVTQIHIGGVEIIQSPTRMDEKNGVSMKYMRYSESFRVRELRQPIYYVPVIIVLILFLLVVFGRSFAIMCTSILWYSTPLLIGGSSTTTLTKKRKAKAKKLEKD